MADDDGLEITLWGVRGSIPTPVAENLGYGGNTSCVSLRHGDAPLLLLDGGSGLRALGNVLRSQGLPRIDVNMLLTHFHWDHIQGIPFFAPIFLKNCRITFHSTETIDALERILMEQMRPPYFPVRMPAVQAECRYAQVDPDGFEPGGFELDGLRIRPFPLTHPDGAHGYRIESERAVIVYATDHEHGNAGVDELIRENARDADILIYDAQYTPEEYETRRGWGHSTWLEATRVAQAAKVKQLVLFHHDPAHDDATLAGIEKAAQREFPATIGAKERWTMRF